MEQLVRREAGKKEEYNVCGVCLGHGEYVSPGSGDVVCVDCGSLKLTVVETGEYNISI